MPIQNDFGKFLGLSADEIQKVNNIPGLDAAIYKSYNNSPPNSAIPRTKIIAKSALQLDNSSDTMSRNVPEKCSFSNFAQSS